MEIFEVQSLLRKAKPEVAEAIKAKCTHSEHEQLKVLLDDLLSPSKDIDDDEVLDWLSWIIAGGLTPEEFSSTVRLYDKATTCGLVWTENFVAYRCRTCGISPCMSLCTECFHQGNHEGHDFIIFRSETGGACDCGEINIIKESGCCSLHGPQGSHQKPTPTARSRSDSTHATSSSSNEQSAPVELLSIANGMMPRLFYRLILSMREESRRRRENPKLSKRVMKCKHNIENNNDITSSMLSKGHKLIKMLQGLSDMGVAMRQVMIHSLTKPHAYLSLVNQNQSISMSFQFKTFLEELVYWTVKFEFPEDLICLLLSMRSDSGYKEDFTRAFILQYKLISETILNSLDPEKLCKHVAAVSVQLFSIEQLAIKMVEQMNLLPLLITTLHEMIEHTMVSIPATRESKRKRKVLDCEHEIMKNNYYWPIKSDLKELLSHQPVATSFFEDEELLGRWFKFLSHFQGMNSIVYIEKGLPHVEQETETHIGAFTAELEISATPMWTLLSHMKDRTTANLTKQIVQHCLQNLLEWSNTANSLEKEISFHLSLHRNLSMFIRQGVQYQNLTLSELLPPKEYLGPIARHLIRLQSTFYQILGRLWSRNGTEILNQAESYVNSLCCNSMIDADIFLLQTIAGSVSKNTFLKIVFEEFDIYKNLGMHFSDHLEPSSMYELDPEEQNTMLESCLLFLATLTSSRTNIGMSDEKLMGLEMSTLLCKGDKLHSELMELLPERCGTDSQLKNFEKVLAEVADYQAPRNMHQGKYVPKPVIWETIYDPVHTLLRSINKAEFQISLDRYQEFVKRSNLCPVTANLWPPFRIPPDDTGPIPDPRLLLSSNLMLEILFIILYRAVHVGNVPNFTIALTIYLLELCLSSNILYEEDIPTPSHLSFFPGNDFAQNIIRKVNLSFWQDKLKLDKIIPDESIISLLLQLHSQLKGSSNPLTPLVEQENIHGESRIGDGAYFVSNLLSKLASRYSVVQTIIKSETVHLDVLNNEQNMEKEREDKRRKAKERKLQVMTELAMKRQQFDSYMKEMGEDITSDNTPVDLQTLPESPAECEFQCVICMEKGGSKFENPYGLITYLTPCSVMSHRKCKDSYGPIGNTDKSFQQSWKSTYEQFAEYFDDASIHLAAPIHLGNGANIQACGHYLHTDCFNSYMNSLTKSRPNINQRDVVQLSYKKFACPLCRQSANSFLPIIKDALGMPSSEDSTCDESELTRLLKKRSTLVLSPKQKQGVEKFLEDLRKVVAFTDSVASSAPCSLSTTSSTSNNTMATISTAQSLNSVFLNSFEMESFRTKGSSDGRRSFLLPLYSVLRYSYKSLSAGHSRKISQMWETISGTKTTCPKGLREIPVLLKDLGVLLAHFVLQLPYGAEQKYINLITQRLTTLKLVQIISGLCLQLDPEDLNQIKSSIVTTNGLQQMLYRVIEALLKSKSYEFTQNVSDIPTAVVSSLLRSGTELESFVGNRMRPFLKKVSQISSLMTQPEHREVLALTTMDTDSCFNSLQTNFSTQHDYSRLIAFPNFDKLLNVLVDELLQYKAGVQELSLSHLILWDEPELIEIPLEYDRIFQNYRKLKCDSCNSVPSEPALCLLCGRIVCLNSFCCLDKQSKISEVIQHSTECGMGSAVFLCVLSSAILVVVGKDACVWGSVFLDTFGEEDLDLRRGKPLFLCKERFQFLQRQWKTHSFHRYELKWFPHDNML